MPSNGPLVRCGGCGRAPTDGPLRRGRCATCYEAWVRARPVGVGASCAGCGDRRRVHLRHYEIGLQANVPGGRWVILCHNCCAAADSMKPPARSVEGLKMRLARDRRFGDRRAESVGGRSLREGLDRRANDRRVSVRDVPLDATELVEETEQIIELEADYELEFTEEDLGDLEEVTGIHQRIDP